MSERSERRGAGLRMAALLILLGAGIVVAAIIVLHRDPTRQDRRQRLPTAIAQPVRATGAPGMPVAAAAITRPTETPVPAYVVRHVLPIDGPIRIGDYYWDERGAPAGPVVITVDLAAQVLSVFRGGYEIGTAAIIYGADDKPTPLGVFPVTQKDANHVSNLYNAPMPYMLRLTNDGVSIHGSAMDPTYMTHGCVGVPKAFARKLFGVVKLGDKAIVTRGETLGIGQSISAA